MPVTLSSAREQLTWSLSNVDEIPLRQLTHLRSKVALELKAFVTLVRSIPEEETMADLVGMGSGVQSVPA